MAHKNCVTTFAKFSSVERKMALKTKLTFITLFRSITMFYNSDDIPQYISHIHTRRGDNYVEYCQSNITMFMDLNNIISIHS